MAFETLARGDWLIEEPCTTTLRCSAPDIWIWPFHGPDGGLHPHAHRPLAFSLARHSPFPAVAYAAAAWCLVYTAAAAYTAGCLPVGVGIPLLTLWGVGLHSTSQTALVVAALAIFGDLSDNQVQIVRK